MIPANIEEKDFRYNVIDPEEKKVIYDELTDVLDDFIKFMKIKEDIVINRAIIGRICERIDQRKDYFLYYHSTPTEMMHMSHEKEISLWVYWICKYKPIRFKEMPDDEVFFINNGCTVSEAFAVFLMLSIVCANKPNKAQSFTPDRIDDFCYDFANRDFSKEAIMARINDLIE